MGHRPPHSFEVTKDAETKVEFGLTTQISLKNNLRFVDINSRGSIIQISGFLQS